MSEMSRLQDFTKGIIKENPVFVALLGMCPALAVTSTVETAVGMGILVIFVLTLSNVIISLVRKLIPGEVRIPAYIVIIATFVTIVRMLTEAYAPALFDSLGIFIPLIVVNCIILGRATSFASKNTVGRSFLDGVGMALGFTLALFTIGFLREFFGTGGISYGVYLPLAVEGKILSLSSPLFNIGILTGPAGGFLVLGILLATFKQFDLNKQAKLKAQRRAEALAKQARNKEAGGLA
jgi:electron transport complex protein RnfE